MFDVTSVLAAVLILAAAAAVWIYNRLVRDRNLVANGWSDIDVQLVRRHELIPNLVAAVQAYSDYEKATLTAVTTLRQHSQQATDLGQKATAEDAIEAGVTRLLAVAEDYPQLKADENFRQLAAELTRIEDHLQYARRFYNGAVRQLNTRVASFPHLLVARACNFQPAQFFAAPADATATPQISLD